MAMINRQVWVRTYRGKIASALSVGLLFLRAALATHWFQQLPPVQQYHGGPLEQACVHHSQEPSKSTGISLCGGFPCL